MRVEAQPAFVLHSREYRDSSLLVDFLTPEYGRFRAVVRGVRGSGRQARQRRGAIQVLVPLLIGWTGKSELKTVTGFESQGTIAPLRGQQLFSALYLNELIMRLIHPQVENPALFEEYLRTLHALAGDEQMDVVLRRFEFWLLDDLGYGIDLSSEGESGAALRADRQYRFWPDRGLLPLAEGDTCPPHHQFPGADLLAICGGDYHDSARRTAKHLCRQALAVHLGDKPLKSRELFR